MLRSSALLGVILILGCGQSAVSDDAKKALGLKTQEESCKAAINHFSDLANAKGTPMPEGDLPRNIEECQQQKWPEALLTCTQKADSIDTVFKDCYKLAFNQNQLNFQPKRVFDVNTDRSQLSPPFGTQGGDVLTFRSAGNPCGLAMVQSGPAVGGFLVCGGKLLAGPLTHDSEYAQVIQLIQLSVQTEMNQGAFDLSKSVRDAWPSGGGSYNVMDATTGKPLYSTY